MPKRLILPTITTTRGSNWRNKIKEINHLKLKEVALFPTCLQKKTREELYSLLEKSSIKRVPFVHLRGDMDSGEIDYLTERFGAQVFNIHVPSSRFPLIHDYSKYKDRIYLESGIVSFGERHIKQFAGVCLDFSHLENKRILHKAEFEHDVEMIEKYPVGVNHISAIKKKTHIDHIDVRPHYDFHHLDSLSELDYLKRYPKKYFSKFIAIELDNTMKEQLKVRDYIEKLIK